jgi:hypothetical protein
MSVPPDHVGKAWALALAGLLLCGASLVSFTIREQRYSTRYQTAASAAGD